MKPLATLAPRRHPSPMPKKTAKPSTWSRTLRAARQGLTVKQAAALIPHLSARTWEGWEAGRVAPPEWAQALILRALAAPEMR